MRKALANAHNNKDEHVIKRSFPNAPSTGKKIAPAKDTITAMFPLDTFPPNTPNPMMGSLQPDDPLAHLPDRIPSRSQRLCVLGNSRLRGGQTEPSPMS